MYSIVADYFLRTSTCVHTHHVASDARVKYSRACLNSFYLFLFRKHTSYLYPTSSRYQSTNATYVRAASQPV